MKKAPRRRKLAFYSGGNHNWGNDRIHRAIVDMIGGGAKSMTYIPSTHENGEIFFRKFKRRYSKYGVKRFRYFPVDSDFLQKEMSEALKSDVIYLAGGNTFYFLKHLRESGFLDRLKKFVERGGILAGLSAGAIILTPNIFLAGYPPHEGDHNEVRLKNLKSLDLVDFEFLPHYNNGAKTTRALEVYSRRVSHPILACPDGSGIVVDGDVVQIYGPAYVFVGGKRSRIA